MIYFSRSTKGFYISEIHGDKIPFDCVEISKEKHDELLQGQGSDKEISSDDNGHPILIDVPAPSAEHMESMIRKQRDTLLGNTDWTQLSDVAQETKEKWIQYRQALRDVPQQDGFPWTVDWPTPPGDLV